MDQGDDRIAPRAPRSERAAADALGQGALRRSRLVSWWGWLAACAIVLCAVAAGAGYALGWSSLDGEGLGSESESSEALSCLVYSADDGWTSEVDLGGSIEAISLTLQTDLAGSISYCVDGASSGWGDWAYDGAVAGAVDGSEGIAGVRILLSGEVAEAYDVWYRVWVDGYGWTGWAQNGWPVGSGSEGAVIEAVEVRLVAVDDAAPGDVTPAVITSAATGSASDVSADDEGDGEAGVEAAAADEDGEDASVAAAASEDAATDDADADVVEAALSQEADEAVEDDSDVESSDAGSSSDEGEGLDDEADPVVVIVAAGDDEAAESAADSSSDVSDASGDESGASDSSSDPESPDSSAATDADASSESADEADEAATVTVTISIDASRAESYGYSVSRAATTLTLEEGATVYDALCALGVSVGGTSTYVSSIAGLAEFACGSGSGWMYSVDGVYPNVACGKYELTGGEVIVWVYTCDLGNDL